MIQKNLKEHVVKNKMTDSYTIDFINNRIINEWR